LGFGGGGERRGGRGGIGLGFFLGPAKSLPVLIDGLGFWFLSLIFSSLSPRLGNHQAGIFCVGV